MSPLPWEEEQTAGTARRLRNIYTVRARARPTANMDEKTEKNRAVVN
jgi:hypothetical protein